MWAHQRFTGPHILDKRIPRRLLKNVRPHSPGPWRAETRPLPCKAAGNEETRRYVPHFVWVFACILALGERRNPSRVPTSDTLLLRVEALRVTRKKLAGFFTTARPALRWFACDRSIV